MLKTIPITVVLLWLLIMYHSAGNFANYWKILGVLRSFCSMLLTNVLVSSVWGCKKVDLSQHVAVVLSYLNRQILDEIPAVRMQCHTTCLLQFHRVNDNKMKAQYTKRCSCGSAPRLCRYSVVFIGCLSCIQFHVSNFQSEWLIQVGRWSQKSCSNGGCSIGWDCDIFPHCELFGVEVLFCLWTRGQYQTYGNHWTNVNLA